MASAHVRRRLTKSGMRYLVGYRLGGREAKLLHAGTFTTEAEAAARRDWVADRIASGTLVRTEAAKVVEKRGEVVYVAGLGDLLKIGVSTDPERRARDLNAELLFVLPGGRQLERELHHHFARYRVRGEWFRRQRQILRHVERLEGRVT